MGNWIEEAEKRQKENNVIYVQGNLDGNDVISINHNNISAFISNLAGLTDRVSRISPEERKPNIELGTTHLEGENRYEFYGSAYLTHQKKAFLLFNRTRRYMYWRRIYINISDTPNIAKITLYEKGTSEFNHDDVKKKKMKFLVKIDSLQTSLNYHIIDWLVYKISSHDLKNHFQVLK